MDEVALREEMCQVGERLWQRGLIGAAEGNLSVRLGPDRILCTPSGPSKGHMSPSDLVVIDSDGRLVEPASGQNRVKPSSEIKLHLGILRGRPDCMAVIHAHPPIATGLSVAGVDIPCDLLPEANYVLGRVITVPFCMPGTDAVPEGLKPYLKDHTTFLLSHHGAATMGGDLWDAYNSMETLERVAHILLVARLAGGAASLPTAAQVSVARLLDAPRLKRI